MTTLDIMRCLAQIHNNIVQVAASIDPGERTIFLGDSIRDLRLLLQELEKDVKAERAGNETEDTDSAKNGEGVS